MRNIFVSIVLGIIFQNAVFSQEFIWKAGNFSFFDNREYFNKYVQPQTMFGTQTFAEAGFKVDEQNSFSAGANFLYEFGSKASLEKLKPILYFRHQSDYVKLMVGSFSREGVYQLPDVLQYDTFKYYRPNHEGIFLAFGNTNVNQNVWLDWTSRQTETDRETFLIGGTGKLWLQNLLIRYDAIMYHYAGTAMHDTTDHIRDNGGLVFSAGFNFTPLTNFDTLFLSTGLTGSYDRLRNVYDLDFRIGNIWELYALYKGIGIKSTFYWGEGQTQMVGDGLYSARYYERTDFIWQFARKGPVKAEVKFTAHFLPEVVDFSQSLNIYIDINGRKQLTNKM